MPAGIFGLVFGTGSEVADALAAVRCGLDGLLALDVSGLAGPARASGLSGAGVAAGGAGSGSAAADFDFDSFSFGPGGSGDAAGFGGLGHADLIAVLRDVEVQARRGQGHTGTVRRPAYCVMPRRNQRLRWRGL